jgi:FMN phosphatase YigB (HAD superfamily)
MRLNNIKLNIKNRKINTIIFDLNGTITSSVSNHPKHIAFRNNYIEAKINKKIETILPEETAKAFEIYGLNTTDYYHYRNDLIDWKSFHSYQDTTYSMLSRLSVKGYHLVLYTDCFLSQINPTLQILQVANFFDLIVSKEMGFKKTSADGYKYISNKFNTPVERLLMVANDYEKDLKPLQDIGGNTVWIRSEKHLVKAQKSLEKYTENSLKKRNSYNLEFT